jgi:hypothetical protein
MLPRNFRNPMNGLLAFAVLIFPATALCRAGSAKDASARFWTRLTATTGRNTDEVAEARTADGTLHVIWLRKNGVGSDLVHTAIDKDGHVSGSPSTILTAWPTLNNPALVVAGGKLRALFGGQRSTDARDPYSAGALYTATSDATGAAWTLEPGAKAPSNSVYASPTGATVAKDGTIVTAWAISFALDAHIGLDPHQPDLKLETRCCTYQPSLATDSETGEVVLEWYSNISKANGLYAQTLLPSQGTAVYVPGSASESRTESLSADQRVGITARRGAPGIYMGYCSGYPACQTVNVWPYKAEKPMVVERAPGARFANITAGPEGRLWVMWMRSGHLFAARSNRAATRFGPPVTVLPPHGTDYIWKVGGEGSLGPLDLLASMTVASQGLATWHTRVLPPLTLTASPRRFVAAQGAKVDFAVTDVGDPVPGAKISVAGKTLTTDAEGRASLAFPRGTKAGAVTATATMKDYSEAVARITAAAK